GLTKGQYSPTSEFHKITKSTPYGSADRPFNPVSLAIGSEATFVARSVDVFQSHLKDTLRHAAAHKGSAFVEILQNCNIFNDGAWFSLTEKDARSEHVLQLEHGKPLVYGKNRDKGIRRKSDGDIETVQLGNGITESDLDVAIGLPADALIAVLAVHEGLAVFELKNVLASSVLFREREPCAVVEDVAVLQNFDERRAFVRGSVS